jgi:hypothetical protein
MTHTKRLVSCIAACALAAGCSNSPKERAPEGAAIHATSFEALGGPFNALAVAGSEFNATFAPGERRQVSVVVTNTGGIDWTSNQVMLHWVPNTPFLAWANTAIVPTVAVGGGQTLRFSITAPATAGPTTFSAMMFLAGTGGGFFGNRLNVPITVGAGTPVLGATLISQNFPSTVAAGAAFSVSVVLQNSGSTTWAAGSNFLFYNRNSPANVWGQVYAKTTADVTPGNNGTYALNLKAPATGAPSAFLWQMYDSQVGFFGDLVNAPVTVTTGGGGGDAGVPDSGPDAGCLYDAGVPVCTAPTCDPSLCPFPSPPPVIGIYTVQGNRSASIVSGDSVSGCMTMQQATAFSGDVNITWSDAFQSYVVTPLTATGSNMVPVASPNPECSNQVFSTSDSTPSDKPIFCDLPDPTGDVLSNSASYDFAAASLTPAYQPPTFGYSGLCAHHVLGGCGDDIENLQGSATFKCIANATVCIAGNQLVTCDANGNITSTAICSGSCQPPP